MEKILVMSDSHASLSLMRRALALLKPAAAIHLGDYYDDGAVMAEEFPHIRFHQVPGNCDRYRCPYWEIQTKCYDICGVRLFMAHGHSHGVKSSPGRLIRDAQHMGAQAALFGHTHAACCYQEEGMWVLNPGAAGGSGTVGLIEVENGQIRSCRILTALELFG